VFIGVCHRFDWLSRVSQPSPFRRPAARLRPQPFRGDPRTRRAPSTAPPPRARTEAEAEGEEEAAGGGAEGAEADAGEVT